MAKNSGKKTGGSGGRRAAGPGNDAGLLSLYGEIVRNMKEGVALVSARTLELIHTNLEFDRLMGYGAGELIGKHAGAVNAPSGKSPEETAKEIRDGLKKNGVWRGEIKNLRKDGSAIWCSVSTTTFDHPDLGTVYLSLHQDITGRRRMETALKDSENNFRNIFNSALDGLLLADAETGRFLMCNKRSCRMLGYSERELLRLTVRDIHPAKALAHVREQFDRQVRGEIEMAPDLPVKRKDGGVFYADINSAPITFYGRKCLMGNFRDVTERRKAELALKQSENLHRTLIDTTDTGYVVIDAGGRVIDANEKYLSFTGYRSLDEIRGRSVLEWTAPHDLKRNGKAVAECARNGRVRNLEIDYVDRRGRTIPIEINATVVEIDGKPQILSICRDISERKKGAEALNSSLKELAEQKKLLEQKNVAFQEVIKAIELEKAAIKDNVARNVSELALPILKRLKLNGASRKYLDLLQKNLAALTASFGREITEKARRLTPREIEISNMIKEGLTSKEIAGLIGASSQTVDKHRKNIRRKLGLNVKKSNLVSFLRSFQ